MLLYLDTLKKKLKCNFRVGNSDARHIVPTVQSDYQVNNFRVGNSDVRHIVPTVQSDLIVNCF